MGIHMNLPHEEWDQEIEDLRQQVQEPTRYLAGINHRQDGSFDESSEEEYDQRYRCHLEPIDLEVDIPDFEGKSQPNNFIGLLNTIERVFDYKEVPENKKVKIIPIKLKKSVLVWWEQQRARRERMGKPKIVSWEMMKKKIKKKYLPKNYLQSLYQKMHVLRQGDRLVDEFQHVVVLQGYWTLAEVYNLAKRVETQHKQPSNRWGAGPNDGGNKAAAHDGDFGRKAAWQVLIRQLALLEQPTSKLDDQNGVLVATSSATSVRHRAPLITVPNCKFINLLKEFYDNDNKHYFEGKQVYDKLVDEEDPEVIMGRHWKMTSCAQTYFIHIVLQKCSFSRDDALPMELPPMCDIQHHIDLIPSSKVPNKVVYTKSPKEHEELQRLV
ncbi:hypothetical protein AMTRI_Chr09g15840 [Amborella trichopoda]